MFLVVKDNEIIIISNYSSILVRVHHLTLLVKRACSTRLLINTWHPYITANRLCLPFVYREASYNSRPRRRSIVVPNISRSWLEMSTNYPDCKMRAPCTREVPAYTLADARPQLRRKTKV